MEVGFTIFDKEGKEHQTVINIPNGSYLPQVGDGLFYDDLFCVIEKRDFQIISAEKDYAWSFAAREK